jgi:hypothetical protein
MVRPAKGHDMVCPINIAECHRRGVEYATMHPELTMDAFHEISDRFRKNWGPTAGFVYDRAILETLADQRQKPFPFMPD